MFKEALGTAYEFSTSLIKMGYGGHGDLKLCALFFSGKTVVNCTCHHSAKYSFFYLSILLCFHPLCFFNWMLTHNSLNLSKTKNLVFSFLL